ncbi:hypothetical protein D9M72_482450 [compost metagenome]
MIANPSPKNSRSILARSAILAGFRPGRAPGLPTMDQISCSLPRVRSLSAMFFASSGWPTATGAMTCEPRRPPSSRRLASICAASAMPARFGSVLVRRWMFQSIAGRSASMTPNIASIVAWISVRSRCSGGSAAMRSISARASIRRRRTSTRMGERAPAGSVRLAPSMSSVSLASAASLRVRNSASRAWTGEPGATPMPSTPLDGPRSAER